MKISNLLLIVLFIVQPLIVRSQENKIKVRAKMSSSKGAMDSRMPQRMIPAGSDNIISLLTPNKLGLITLKSVTTTPELISYSKDGLRNVGSFKVDDKENERIETIEVFSGKSIAIVTQDKPGEGTAISYIELDPELNGDGGTIHEICVLPGTELGRNRSVWHTKWLSSYLTDLSRDSSIMLISSPEFRAEEDEAIIKLAVVGSDMQALWSNLLVLETRSQDVKILDIAVDNDGVVYLMAKENFGKKDVAGGKVNFEFALYTVDGNSAIRSALDFPDDVQPFTAELEQLPNGGFVCGGTYAKLDIKDDHVSGNYFATMLPNEKSFGSPVIHEFMPLSENKAFKGYYMMKLVDLLVNSEGEAFVVNNVASTRGNQGTQWYFSTVIVSKFESDGTLQWMTRLPRFSAAVNPVTGKVQPGLFNDQLFLFTLDSDKLKEARKADPDKIFKSGGGAYSAYFVFDEGGKYKQKSLMKGSKSTNFFRGYNLEYLGYGQFVTLGTKGINNKDTFPVLIDITLE